MTEGATGTVDETGVVLRAIDEFDANIQKYLADLRKVQASNQKLSDDEKRAAAAATAHGEAAHLSAQKVSRYGMAALMVSGQVRELRPAGAAAAQGITLVSEAAMGAMGPIGAVLAALGAAAAVTIELANAQKKATEHAQNTTDRLIEQAAKTGILNEAEELLIASRKIEIELKLREAEATLANVTAMGMELTVREKLHVVMLSLLDTAFHQNTMWVVAAEHVQNERAELGELTLKLREYREQLKLIDDAVAGGTNNAPERAKALADAAMAAIEARAQAIGITFGNIVPVVDAALRTVAEMEERFVVDSKALFETKAFSDYELWRMGTLQIEQELAKRKAADEKAAADRMARGAKVSMVLSQQASLLGDAVGQAAAGQTGAWKAAAASEVQLGVAAAEKYLAVKVTQYAAAGNYAMAALAAAGILAVHTLGSKAVGELQQMPTEADRYGDRSGYGRSGPSINVQGIGYYDPYSDYAARASAQAGHSGASNVNAPVNANLSITVQGDVNPATAQAWKQEAQAWLDQQMPRWEERQRAVGARR